MPDLQEFASQRRLLTVPETAEMLSISRSTTYTLIQKGLLPVTHIAGCTRIAATAVEALIAENTHVVATRTEI